ncbi:MAG: flagellar hook capping FlgD N-terminal domain-containing protein [Phycisphaerae bacterium]
MDAIQSSTPLLQAVPGSSGVTERRTTSSFGDLGGDDFFGLLIAQLTNQDPLEPTDNAELLRQIASIRDIELSTTLADSIRSLTDHQQVAGSSALIGRYVTSVTQPDGSTMGGVVVGVRFGQDGQATLQLATGESLPMAQVASIASAQEAAEALVGLMVSGVDGRTGPSDGAEPRVVSGVVTSVTVDDAGEVVLELDTGEDLRFRDVVGMSAPG